MASLTYCRSTRGCCYRVEQIVLLIIAFLVYANGIRNSAPSKDLRETETSPSNGYIERPSYQQVFSTDYDDQVSITPPSPAINPINSHKDFRPSQQILDFTLSDATPTLQKYPPSYLSSNYNGFSTIMTETTAATVLQAPYRQQLQQHQEPQQPLADKRYNNEDAQFSFPSEMLNVAGQFSGNFGNNINGITASSVSTVPPYMQTTPVLSYRDPYTYDNYRGPSSSTPSSSKLQFQANNNDNDNDIIYYGQQGSAHQREDAPQAYTVQSTLLVGTNPNRDDFNSVSHDFDATNNGYRPLSSPNNEYKRPGYVFDEQIRPNYISNANKYNRPAQHQTQKYSTAYVNSPRKPPMPQRLSYDSHDYPPPSYYQRPTYQHHQQQQQQQQQKQQQQHSAYFQTPQRQDIGLNSIPQPTEQFNVDYLNVASAPTTSAITTPSTFSNYANNFGNYLLNDADQQQQHTQYNPYQHQKQEQYPVNYKPSYPPGNYYPHQNRQEPQQSKRPPTYWPPAQTPSNYYDYQLGEIPPGRPRPRPTPPHDYPNYAIQRPTEPPSGLASLASLFTTTQQYAPQFTNLLLGAFTGGGGGSGGGAGASSTHKRPSQQQRPINMQLIKALENIARNDDLQCVPKVLCQTIAGQTQRGQLPSFITSPAITNFLAGFPAASPALIYGRAALLGISGGERSCTQTYAKCPKSEYEILHYLNNHRGGFFKFFSEPEEQPATSSSTAGSGSYDDNNAGGGGGVSSLLNILSVLTGNPASTQTKRPSTTTTTTPRPASTLDVAGGIGNFFTQVLSDYLSGVEYQRRRRRRQIQQLNRRRRNAIEPETDLDADTMAATTKEILKDEDFHDDEDNEDTDVDHEDDIQYDDVEARILHRDETPNGSDYPKFFPEEHSVTLDEAIKTFNAEKSVRKLKFPNTEEDNRVPTSGSWIRFRDNVEAADQNYAATTATKNKRRGKKVQFTPELDYERYEESHSNIPEISPLTTTATRGQRIIFPDHYEQHIRKGRILNRPNYAASYGDYVRTTADENDRFVLSNAHRRPHYQELQGGDSLSGLSTPSTHYYNQVESQYLSTSSTSSDEYSYSTFDDDGYDDHDRYPVTQETGFRPTPIPISSSFTASSLSQGQGSSSSYYHTNANSNYKKYNNYNNYNNYNKKQYNYPNNNYVSNNRYSSNYQRPTTTTTRRPRHEDDKNVYVTNGRGVTEYYITPDGRKVYL